MFFLCHFENSCWISTQHVRYFLECYSSSGSQLSWQSFHNRTVYSFQFVNYKIWFELKLQNMLNQKRPLLTSWTSSLRNKKQQTSLMYVGNNLAFQTTDNISNTTFKIKADNTSVLYYTEHNDLFMLLGSNVGNLFYWLNSIEMILRTCIWFVYLRFKAKIKEILFHS